MYMCPECTSTFRTVNALKTHLNEAHIELPTLRDERENSITLENNLDGEQMYLKTCQSFESLLYSSSCYTDLDEEEMEQLLRKQTTVNTITIAVDKGGGELW